MTIKLRLHEVSVPKYSVVYKQLRIPVVPMYQLGVGHPKVELRYIRLRNGYMQETLEPGHLVN
jgi:hypothetical protein